MAWYRTGTVTVTNNSNVVTGVGTSWVDAVAIGETFLGPDAQVYEITSIVSATSLRISPNYKGSTAAAQSYAIMPTQSYLRDLAAQAAALVNSYAAVRDNAGAGKFAAGTVAAPSLRAIADEDTGVNLPGNNVLQLVTGGVERLRIAADGTPSGDVMTKAPVSTAQKTALDAKETPAGALAQMRMYGLGVASGNPRIFTDWYGSGSGSGFYGTDDRTVGDGGPPVVDGPQVLLYMRYSSTAVRQILGGLGNSSKMFTRNVNSSGAGPWRQFAFTDYAATTASSANAVMGTDGNFSRSTSSLKYKIDVEDVDAAMMQRVIDEAHPIWYRSTCAADRPDHSWWGLGAEELGAIDPRFVHWAHPNKTVERQEQVADQIATGEVDGVGQPIYRTETRTQTISEQVPDTDAPLQPEGVMYERLVVPLLWKVQQMQQKLQEMQERFDMLEGGA